MGRMVRVVAVREVGEVLLALALLDLTVAQLLQLMVVVVAGWDRQGRMVLVSMVAVVVGLESLMLSPDCGCGMVVEVREPMEVQAPMVLVVVVWAALRLCQWSASLEPMASVAVVAQHTITVELMVTVDRAVPVSS